MSASPGYPRSMPESMAIYLRNHEAAARGGVDLFRRTQAGQAGPAGHHHRTSRRIRQQRPDLAGTHQLAPGRVIDHRRLDLSGREVGRERPHAAIRHVGQRDPEIAREARRKTGPPRFIRDPQQLPD